VPTRESESESLLRALTRSRAFVWGLALMLVGSGPLLAVVALAALGLYPDPNPNPIGFGLLAGLTFWPAVILMVVGLARTLNARRR
jgi:zinc transporter ZupT